MKTKREIMSTIKAEYEEKKLARESYELIKKEQLYNKYPKLLEIDENIKNEGIKLCMEAFKEDDESKEILENLENFQKQREEYIRNNNVDIKSVIPDYDCKECKDRGIIDMEDGSQSYCNCFKNRYITLAYENSNISKLFSSYSFENFDPEIFDDEISYGGITQRENMKALKLMGERYCEEIKEGSEKSLIFYGNTGIGKTYLSICIAKRAIENGMLVVYTSATEMFERLQEYSLDNDKTGSLQKTFYDFVVKEGLLVIDDLGTESSSEFKTSQLFNIINMRGLYQKPTIISTNLNSKKLLDKYDQRIFSRLSGGYKFYEFKGKDIRQEF